MAIKKVVVGEADDKISISNYEFLICLNDQYYANAEVSSTRETIQDAAIYGKNSMSREAILNLPHRCHDCVQLEWLRS